MNINRLFPALLAVVLFMVAVQPVCSQQAVSLLPDQSSIKIKGTSNLHDWEESVKKFKVNLDLSFDENEIKGIDKVHVSMQSGSIASDNKIMTNKTHEALLVKKYPEIEFRLVSVNNLSSKAGKFSGTLTGDITLAGVTKRTTLAFSGNNSGNRITIQGSKELNMNDFKIDPPTAMMGALKTGKEVTVDFHLQFQIINELTNN